MTHTHSPEDLERIYARRFARLGAYRQQVWQVLVTEFFQSWIPENGAVLDLGCGHCEFINAVRAVHRYGLDLNPQSQRSALPGTEILLHDCSTPWPLQGDSLDVVFTSNFFEHLESKSLLEATLAQAHRCLTPGGRLIAVGPNIRYLAGAYWDFFDHHLPLTDLSLVEVLEKLGFEIEERISRFLPYTMSQGRTPPLWTLRAYLRLRPVWRLFGRQFLVIARKPGPAMK